MKRELRRAPCEKHSHNGDVYHAYRNSFPPETQFECESCKDNVDQKTKPKPKPKPIIKIIACTIICILIILAAIQISLLRKFLHEIDDTSVYWRKE